MSAATLTQTIGRTLTELRQSRGWTLKTLSEATGVSVPVLSKIENNQTGISFETAMKIMGSLSLSLDDLTGDKREPLPISGRRAINPAGSALKIPSMGRSYELFATDLRQKRMVPMITTVHVRNADEWGPLSRHDGEEWMYDRTSYRAVRSLGFEDGRQHLYRFRHGSRDGRTQRRPRACSLRLCRNGGAVWHPGRVVGSG
jgi:transcriptional regulator with XRE-family HTH domain